MTYTVSITSQGQLSLPIQVRRQLGFKLASRALLSIQDGKVMVEPIKDVFSLKGIVRSTKKVTVNQIRNAFEDSLAKVEEK